MRGEGDTHTWGPRPRSALQGGCGHTHHTPLAQGAGTAGQKPHANRMQAARLRSPFQTHTKLPGNQAASPETKPFRKPSTAQTVSSGHGVVIRSRAKGTGDPRRGDLADVMRFACAHAPTLCVPTHRPWSH